MTNPANKTILITGAGGGFGRQMVLQFCAAGAKLLLTDINDQALQSAVDDAGSDLVASFTADLSSEAGCAAVVETCASLGLSLIHISEPTRLRLKSRMPSSA